MAVTSNRRNLMERTEVEVCPAPPFRLKDEL
jgi:hypothetical protein